MSNNIMKPTIERQHKQTVQMAIDTWLDGDKKLINEPNTLDSVHALFENQIAHYKRSGIDYEFTKPKFGDQESIRNHMIYISDRFVTGHRLEWLFWGITLGKFK